MYRKLTTLALVVACASCFSSLLAQEFNPAVMSPELIRELQGASPEAYHEVFLLLRDRVDVEAFDAQYLRSNAAPEQRMPALLNTLQSKAAMGQKPLLEVLRRSAGVDPANIQSYWITNLVFVRIRKQDLANLSWRNDIEAIEKNEELFLTDAAAPAAPAPPVPNGKEPGLTTINAPAMWALGYTGYGRKIMILDSGQDPSHPSLRRQFAYNYASLSQTYLSTAFPDFCETHGTTVASMAVGMDPLTRDTVGVAFNAQWIGAPLAGLLISGTQDPCSYKGTVRNAFDALQWALNPDGNTSTTSDVPDVVNNSFGRALTSTAECASSWRETIRTLDAAGIAVVWAAGNEGPDPGTVLLQASIVVNDVAPLSVGAISNNSLLIADFSGRGPSLCTNLTNPNWSVKPEVVAPGVSVRGASPGSPAYVTTQGTSFSAPYVAGAILLLKEAFPTLSGQTIARTLYNTARDLGTPGEDNDYGRGLIDVFAAYQDLVARGFQPAAPAQPAVNVAQLDFNPRLLNCAGQLFLDVTFENNGATTISNLDIVVRKEFTATPLTTIRWEGNLAPGQRTTYLIPEFAAPAGKYAIEVELRQPNGVSDLRPLDNQMKKQVTVSEQALEPSVQIASTPVCSGSRTLLRTNYTGDAALRWYAAPSGGTILAEGSSFYTGALTKDTIFYADLRFSRKVGKADNTGGITALSDSTTGGLVFDCFAPFLLKTVLVYVDVTGPRNVRLRRADGSIVQQRFLNITRTGANRLTLNFNIEPGENYVLDISVGREMYVNRTGVGYPYEIAGVVRIKRDNGPLPFIYSYFYDWEVDYNAPCGRVPARVKVNASSAAVKASFTHPLPAAMLSNGEAPVTFKDNSTGAVQWRWNFGDGNSSTSQNPTNIYRKPGNFIISLAAINSEGCSDVDTARLEVTGVTSIAEQRAIAQRIQVFPNPSSGDATVQFALESPQQLRLELTDLLGRQLLSQELGRVAEGNFPLSLHDLPAGTYMLVVSGETFQVGKRVVRIE